jgi:hypothetical protein
MRNLLFAGLGSRDESVAHDVVTYLGRAEVIAKAVSPRNRERKEHCHAHDTRRHAQNRGDPSSPGFQKIAHFTLNIAAVPRSHKNGRQQDQKHQPVRAFYLLAPAAPIGG